VDKEAIVAQVMQQLLQGEAPAAPAKEPASCIDTSNCAMTEFVGALATGDVIGLVIANIDEALHEQLGYDKKYHSLGILGCRSGGGPEIMAADEAVKATNTELISFELPRDTKGGGGHGSFLVFGAEDVSDARRAIEIALNALKTTYYSDCYFCDPGHMELQYTARASHALSRFMGAVEGKAFGLICGCPAAVGILMADATLKAADVAIVAQSSPAKGTSFTNEFCICISGDSGAVKQAVLAGRETGMKLLRAMGGEPVGNGKSYIG